MFPRLFFFGSLLLLPGVALASFADVPVRHAFHEAVDYVEREGIVSGYPDGTFRPDRTINRAEFTKIIVGATVPENRIVRCASRALFRDIPADAWFASFVCTARRLGLVAGYRDGSFKPEQPINVAEAAKIIVGAFGGTVDHGSVWYEPYIRWLAGSQIIPLTISRVDQPLTRGEMAEMIWRLRAEVHDRPSRTVRELLGESASSSSASSASSVSLAFFSSTSSESSDSLTFNPLCTDFRETPIPGVDMDAVRAAWLGWINDARAAEGLSAYRYNVQLHRTAFLWSKYSADRGELSHLRPGQTDYYDYAIITRWFADLGLTFANVSGATYTENIGRGPFRCSSGDCTQAMIDAIRTTFDFYMREKDQANRAHYNSVMNRSFTEIGMGIAIEPVSHQYYLTTHYGTRITSDPPPFCR